MDNKKRLVLSLTALALFGCIVWVSCRQQGPVIPFKMVAISKIRVIAGHEFDVVLEDGRRIHGMLEISTPTGPGSNVAKKVSDLINESSNPRVKLLGKEKDSDIWRLDLYLTRQGKEIQLSRWLKENKLLWE